MSTTLPNDAPADDTAVPSVEDQAPVAEGEVAAESVGSSEDVVPASRFNGLMSKFNQTQSELNEMRTQFAELEARLNGSEQQQETTPEVSDNSNLEARVQQLQEMLVQERIESAREKALKDYPEAAPFADLIVADTPDDVREMARLIAERAKAANPASATQETETQETEEPSTEGGAPASAEAATEASTEPPVAGGGAAFSSEASADDRVVDAIQRGSFADFVNAKWEKQSVSSGQSLNLG